MGARSELDQIRQRAEDPRAKYHHGPCSAPVCGSRHCQTARDRNRLLALALAIVDLADGMDARDDVYAEQEHPNETVAIEAVPVHELRAAITEHLTSKETDS